MGELETAFSYTFSDEMLQKQIIDFYFLVRREYVKQAGSYSKSAAGGASYSYDYLSNKKMEKALHVISDSSARY